MNDWHTRKTPPEKDEEWQVIWAAAYRANAMWKAGGGAVSTVVANWKFWAAVVAIVAWINRPEIAQALQTLVGG